MIDKKEYIGDGAYVSFDGYQIVLTAENGITATDTVALEPRTLANFEEYVKRLRAHILETYNQEF